MLILTEFMIMLRQPWCAPTSIIEWSRLTVVETKWEGGDSCGYAEESLPSPAEFSFKLRPAFEMIFTWRQMPTAPMNMMWKTNKSDRMEKLKWAGWGGGKERGVSSSMDPTSIKVLKVEHGISPSYIPQRPPRSSAWVNYIRGTYLLW